MALITNVGIYPTTVRDNTGRLYEIAPGGNVTIPDAILSYSAIDDGIARGWITVANYTDPDRPVSTGGEVAGLTDAQLRAAAVPVSLATTPGLTDAQLRAAAVPVSMATTPGLTDAQLRASDVGVKPSMASGGNVVITVNGGATPVAFTSQACKQLTIANDSGTVLEFSQDAGSNYMPIFDSTYYTIFGISNTNQIRVRRKDIASTSTVVKARWEA